MVQMTDVKIIYGRMMEGRVHSFAITRIQCAASMDLAGTFKPLIQISFMLGTTKTNKQTNKQTNKNFKHIVAHGKNDDLLEF